MTIVVPALSEDGWVDYPAKQADYIFGHFFLSDYSQTYLYKNQVSSFAQVMQEHQGDVSKIARQLESTLRIYFLRYFSKVEVECDAIQDPDNPNKFIVRIYLTYTGTDGIEHNLGKMVNVLNSKIESVIALSNYGTNVPKDI